MPKRLLPLMLALWLHLGQLSAAQEKAPAAKAGPTPATLGYPLVLPPPHAPAFPPVPSQPGHTEPKNAPEAPPSDVAPSDIILGKPVAPDSTQKTQSKKVPLLVEPLLVEPPPTGSTEPTADADARPGPLATNAVPPPANPIRQALPADACPATCPMSTCCRRGLGAEEFWFRADYLLWWTRGQSYPALVTTSPQGTPAGSAGVLGQPSTTALFGGQGASADPRSGGRFTVGWWFPDEPTVGVLGRFFFLGSHSNHFGAASGGDPILAIPYVDPSGNQRRLITAYPGLASGSTYIDTFGRLSGFDTDFMLSICQGCCYRVDALLGWRYLRLHEGFGLLDTENLLGKGNVVVDRIQATDGFDTRNSYNGADLGLRGQHRSGYWIFDFMAKVALGVNRQTVNITGSSVDFNGNTLPGGIFALSSNIGQYHRSVFAVVPEVDLSLGYALTPHVRLLAGYTFLYFGNVARPGNQIDTTINTNLLPPAIPGGPARPAFAFHNSDFWAQGINFGAQVSW